MSQTLLGLNSKPLYLLRTQHLVDLSEAESHSIALPLQQLAFFSCASCHPDGHTDQLLWVLKTPIVEGGNQIMPRSTMPVQGLRDTAPFHWDGIPGDPYGGINSASLRSHVEPNSSIEDPASQTRVIWSMEVLLQPWLCPETRL